MSLSAEATPCLSAGSDSVMAVAAQLGADGVPVAQAATSAFLDGWTLSMIIAAGLAVLAAAGSAAMLRGNDDESVIDLDAATKDDELLPA